MAEAAPVLPGTRGEVSTFVRGAGRLCVRVNRAVNTADLCVSVIWLRGGV